MHHNTTRTEWIDIAKGIGILLVVMGHSGIPGTKLIYSFHMPLFFIISGMLYKKNKPIREYSSKIAKRYILPYFILCFINLIIIAIKEQDLYRVTKYIVGIVYSRGTTEWMPNCSPLWFLTCISVALFFFNLLQNYCKKVWLKISILILCILISYSLDILNAPKLVWNIDTALMSLLFLEVGKSIWKSSDKIANIINTRYKLWIILLLCIGGVAALKNPIELMVNFDNNEYGNILLMLIAAFCISLSLLALIYMSNKYLSKSIRKMLVFYGEHTIFIMGFDYFSGSIAHLVLRKINFENSIIVFIIKMIILTVGIFLWKYIRNQISNNKLKEILDF